MIAVCNPALNLQLGVSCQEDPPVSLFPRLNNHSSLQPLLIQQHHSLPSSLQPCSTLSTSFLYQGRVSQGQNTGCSILGVVWQARREEKSFLLKKLFLPTSTTLHLSLMAFPKLLSACSSDLTTSCWSHPLLSSLPDLLPLANFRSEDWSHFKSRKIVKRLHCAADGWCKPRVTSLQAGYDTLSYSVFTPLVAHPHRS